MKPLRVWGYNMSAEIKFQLKHGLSYGKGDEKIIHLECTIRPESTADIIKSRYAAEKVFNSLDGPIILMSETKYSIELLGRKIVSIGSVNGPFSEEDICLLHPQDFLQITSEMEKLEEAVFKAMEDLTARGRVDSTSG